jgi:hypothetical protein
MTVLETVGLYYDAWQNKRGDFSAVPLADDFEFIGPVASFGTAEGYRAMAARPMDFTGRPMRGFVTVQPEGLKAGQLRRWVQEAVARAESLPPR